MEENKSEINDVNNDINSNIDDLSSYSQKPLDVDFINGYGFKVADEVIPETESETEFDSKKAKKHSKNKKKNKSVVKSVIWIVAIIVVSVGLALGVIYAGADYMGIGFGRGKECELVIKEGTSAAQIAEQLEEQGAVKVPMLFRLYAKMKGYDSQFKYGLYTYNTEAGYEALCEMLITQGHKAESVSVKIPEYATIDDMAVLLSDAGVCEKADFYDAVQNGEYDISFVKDIPVERVHYRLEGYLFPDTYDFYCYDSEECAYLAVKKMLKATESKLTKDMLEQISKRGYTLHEVLTMASIVESESANGSAEDRAKVAAVFYNRLEGKNWNQPKLLQTDPSTYYPYGNGRYNTYKTEGLPPGPIGAPSLNSIKAAINPAKDFKATYFVTDKNAKFYFNETLTGHNKTIADLKRQGLWLYTQLGS